MAKKCLGCGNKSDSGLYLCSVCLNKINEARRGVDLRKRDKKHLLNNRKILLAFSLGVSVFFVAVVFTEVYKAMIWKLSTKAFWHIMLIYFFCFAINFFVTCLMFKQLITKLKLAMLFDKSYYLMTPERGFLRIIRAQLKFLMFCFAVGILQYALLFGGGVLLIFTDIIESARRSGFNFSGSSWAFVVFGSWFTAVAAVSYRYCDWISGLEK